MMLDAARYVLCFCLIFVGTANAKAPFAVDDYFTLKRVVELALSSDGKYYAGVVQRQSLEENELVRQVFLGATQPKTLPEPLQSIPDARNLAWIAGTHSLAFLSNKDGIAQLYSVDVPGQQIRQHTEGGDPVVQFSFAPDGSSLAWVTMAAPTSASASFYQRVNNGTEGVVIDSENTFVSHFVDPARGDYTARPSTVLWLKRADAPARKIELRGVVNSFHWSSDATRLSIAYVEDDIPRKSFFNRYTSMAVYDVRRSELERIAQARAPSETQQAEYYDGGEWVPGENKILLRRSVERDSWTRTVSWTQLDLSRRDLSIQWHPIEMYGGDPEPVLTPAGRGLVYSNQTIQARRSLYELGPAGLERAGILASIDGSVSLVRFNATFDTAVFVNDALQRPEELFVWKRKGGVQQLSGFNTSIAAKILPIGREVTWRSADGVTVRGWLLVPPEGDERRPLPLITFVHGGPGAAVMDGFAREFADQGGGIWPYPFETYALNGMAVFIPNYRGTRTFGAQFSKPRSLSGEPVDDVITGIQQLIRDGVADEQRLAICGFSHGSWLGPLVMTRMKNFRAGSFAEASLNGVVNYSLLSGWVNRNINDVHTGVSLYDNPQQYVDNSPELHFKGLNTAVLFEAGIRNNAIAMMGAPKAAQYAGMPAEFVIYPQTGHGMRFPRLQKESAVRNLDWFRFWLLGEEDSDPAKTEQYMRWRKMREERCTQTELPSPPYCELNAQGIGGRTSQF